MYFLPVKPLLTKEGALAVLVNDLGMEGATPVPLADPARALSNFNVVSDALSISIAARLGVGSIFSGAVSAKDRGFYFDAMTYTDAYQEHTLPDRRIYATRWGVGIRVLLRVLDIAGNASLNFGLVGAAVELQQARAQYEITGIGIGIDGLVIVLEELPAIGDFKYETYQKLNGAVVKKLAAYIKEHKAQLVPQPVAVGLTANLDPLRQSRSVYYAIRSIADRRPLNEALSGASAVLDRDVVRSIYVQITNSDDAAAKPDRESERVAEEWLAP